jgi:hypothetical protein
MHRIPVVRAVVLALVAAGACTAAPAAAQGRCTAPEEPAREPTGRFTRETEPARVQ